MAGVGRGADGQGRNVGIGAAAAQDPGWKWFLPKARLSLGSVSIRDETEKPPGPLVRRESFV